MDEAPLCEKCHEELDESAEDGLCAACADRDCSACQGTGIAVSGPVEGNCRYCGGKGWRNDDFDGYDPREYLD